MLPISSASGHHTRSPRVAAVVKIKLPDEQRNFALLEPDVKMLELADVDDAILREIFIAHGAVLLRGFPFSVEAFGDLAARHCSSFVSNESSEREQISDDGRIQTVNLGPHHFPLHPELSRVPWQPDIAWFACEQPATLGGETAICDGIAAANAFRPAMRAHLQSNTLNHTERVTEDWCREFLNIDDLTPQSLNEQAAGTGLQFRVVNGQILRTYLRPMLHRPLFSESLAYGNFLVFARQGLRVRTFPTYADGSEIPDNVVQEIVTVTNDLAVPIRWQKGDVIMLDNTRFMHGRSPIGDPETRRIYTQFGYAAFLPEDHAYLADQPWRRPADTAHVLAPRID